MSIIVDRVRIALYAIFKSIVKQKSNNQKNVLIIFQQVFGDSIILSSTLREYIKLYPVEDGYSIRVLLRPSILAFMKANLPLPEEIEYIPVDFTRLVNDYMYFREISEKYCEDCYVSIVPGSSLSAELLSDTSCAQKRIGLVAAVPRIWPLHMWLFQKLAYTDKVIPKKDEMMLQRHRRLLNYLGNTSYKAVLPNVISKNKIIKGAYVVVCAGASTSVKCWPTERFIEVIDYIIERYGMNVHLCGGKEEEAFENQIIKKAKNAKHIVSHVGKTSFSDWSAIVQHAELVIGNDSATLHLAAAARVPSICIAGVYDKYQFFPYKVDELLEGDILPHTVLVDMPCSWCRTKGYFAGYGNSKCKSAINQGKCAVCVDAVTVNLVKEEISRILM